MAVPSPHSIKTKLRKEARTARMRFVARLEDDTRRALEEQLAEILSPHVAGAHIVAVYHAIGSEISLAPTIARARRLGKTVAYPTFDKDDDTFRFRAGEPAMPGPHQIMQPDASAPAHPGPRRSPGATGDGRRAHRSPPQPPSTPAPRRRRTGGQDDGSLPKPLKSKRAYAQSGTLRSLVTASCCKALVFEDYAGTAALIFL